MSSNALDKLANELSEYESVRQSPSPVRIDADTGVCSVYSYNDVTRMMRDFETFSNTPPGATYESQNAMVFIDPPHHRELRGLVSKAFTPASIAGLESRLTQISNELLGDVLGKPSFDVVQSIAGPLPEIMIAEMLGVDTADRHEFRGWARSFTMVVTSQAHAWQDLGDHLRVLDEMFGYFDAIVADRRASPRDDLITALVQAEEEGTHLSSDELRATCAQLLAAGNETTTNLIGNAFICLAQRPELVEQLRTEPELVPGVVEEVLRWLTPVQFVPRYAKKRVTLHGQTIEPGTAMLAMLSSANRDKDWFDQADDFNPRRYPNRHLGFGTGIHFCLGAALARLEAKVAIDRMLAKTTGAWSIVPDNLERVPEAPLIFGVRSLPLSVDRWATV